MFEVLCVMFKSRSGLVLLWEGREEQTRSRVLEVVLIQEMLISSERTCEATWFSKQDPPCYVTGRWAAGNQRETAARAWK